MGIPVYFKTLVTEYQDSILIKHRIDNVDALFFDLNCLIHPCCRGETDESVMIQKIIDSIDHIIQYTKVQSLVYLAIDGVAPKGKMKQQRMRRHKSILEKKEWDTNAISPGTYFMQKLNIELKKLHYDNLTLLISDSNERGEGEHKILQYIRENTLKQNTVIYGLDADLIMLSLVSGLNNIYLLRERTEYNIEDTDSEYIYMKIDFLKQMIEKDMNVNDYIFICFLLGNDFMNHIPSLNLRYNGYHYLIETYRLLQDRYQGYFQLIDLQLPHLIHLPFLKEYIHELSLNEKKYLMTTHSIRKKQANRICNQYLHEFQDFQKGYPNAKDLFFEDISNYQGFDPDKTKEMIENLPMFYLSDERKQMNEYSKNTSDDLCNDYLLSLVWTSHYYFKGCIHWRWATKYNRAPLLKDFTKYLSKLTQLTFDTCSSEYTCEEQLKYILPSKSQSIHPYSFHAKEYQMKIDPFLCRYLWECHVDFI